MNISVYITSYNQKSFLIEAIDSVLAQSLQPSQIIIVDDASNDGSQEIISGYHSQYPNLITPVYHQKNLGISQTRVDAMQMVTGDYVTYLDGDDRFISGKLEAEYNALISTSYAKIAFSNNYYIDKNGQRLGTWIKRKLPPQGDVFCQTFTRDFPRGNLFRMELISYPFLKQTGFHDTNLRLLEDWDIRIRLTKNLQTVYVDNPLSEIRRHNIGLSKLSAAEKIKALDYIWEKNRFLLKDISKRDQIFIEKGIDRWKAKFLRWRAKEILGLYQDGKSSNRTKAFRLYQQSWAYYRFLDLDLIFGLIIPHKVYRQLRRKFLLK